MLFLVLAAIGTMVLLMLFQQQEREPSYSGKTLKQWLHIYRQEPWTFWSPNEYYGHIHDELWEKLVEVMKKSNSVQTVVQASSPIASSTGAVVTTAEVLAVRQIGTNAIPRLIQLMSSRSTPWQKIRRGIAERLPAGLSEFVCPYASLNPAQDRQIMAYDGFKILGANAAPALSALSNLLFRSEVDLPLTRAISDLGPEGIALLTNALTPRSRNWRNDVALALGLQGEGAKAAVPSLLSCVEQGNASYDVLGALGRIGCDDPRLVKALIRLLRQRGSRTNIVLQEDMAFILLGLQGEKARAAAPLVVAEFRRVGSDTNAAADRRFYRRILRTVAPDLEKQLPPPRSADEVAEYWP